MKPRWMIIWTVLLFSHAPVWADAPKVDLIPELKDIEKIAAEQEAAIRAQSEALQKAQQEKELAEKAAKEAIDKQTAVANSAPAVAPEANTKPERKVATTQPKAATKPVKKAPAEPIEKTNPWLAQERRYSFP
jgi:peptidoglycan hydrolase CwlO-like protein